jgi:hypothetical protein
MASTVRMRWKRRRDVEQFLLGQTDQGTAHQRAEGQCVGGVG